MSSTIYDVASRAGVSIATVSRALNAPQSVHVETLTRIQSAIDELKFVPKAEAAARARRAHRQIGVLAPFFMHYPSFTQRLRGVAGALRNTGYDLVVYNVDSAEHARNYLQSLPISQRLDGMLILSLRLSEAESGRFLQNRLPAVLIEGSSPQLAAVEIDNVAGGVLAADYLVARGHRLIGFVGGDRSLAQYTLGTSALRYEGFVAALGRYGLAPCLPGYVPLSSSHEEARLQALDLLQQPERPSAIFAGNDTLALGVLKAARELGVRVPAEVAVLGFDDADFAEYIGLSTVSQALEESGRLAVELLLSLIADPTRTRQHIRLPLQVISRDTT